MIVITTNKRYRVVERHGRMNPLWKLKQEVLLKYKRERSTKSKGYAEEHMLNGMWTRRK